MRATSRLLTVLLVLTALAAFPSACAPASGTPQTGGLTTTPTAGGAPAPATPVPSLTKNPGAPFVQSIQSDMPPMAPTLVGLSKGLDAARANGTWVPMYPAAMDALSLQESGLNRDKPSAGAYRLAANVRARIDIINPYRGNSIDWRMIQVETQPFATDAGHSYAGHETFTFLPGRYLERTSDRRELEIAATQLQQGNRVDIWFKDQGSPSSSFAYVDITVVLVDAP